MKKNKTHIQGNCYVRYGKFPIEQVLPKLGTGKHVKCQGMKAKCGSIRLRTFAKSRICAGCGLEATFFAVEHERSQVKTKCSPHVNMYGVDSEGREIMFTKDHIIPFSVGGPTTLDNLQTMCTVCNAKKGVTIPKGYQNGFEYQRTCK